MLTLKDLTTDLYLRYKRLGLSDKQVAAIVGCHAVTIRNFKKKHGLTGIRSYRFSGKNQPFPEMLERAKKKFEQLYKTGWTHSAIAEELGIGETALTRFKRQYYPEWLKREESLLLTKEQWETARENGLKEDTIYKRLQRGMKPEEAITKPAKIGRPKKREGE